MRCCVAQQPTSEIWWADVRIPFPTAIVDIACQNKAVIAVSRDVPLFVEH
jgi:hypothetical protein